MATELWVTLVVAGVAIIACVTLVNHAIDQHRLRRMRELAAITHYLRQVWSCVEDIPPQYLPMALRHVVAKAMLVQLHRGLTIAPAHEPLEGEGTRIEVFASAPDGVVVPINPARRRDIRRQLLALKRVCGDAAARGHVSFAEAADAEGIVNALALRILVDHLVDAAGSAEHRKHFEESIALYERALGELARLPGVDTGAEQAALRARLAAVRTDMAEHRRQQEIEAEEALQRNWAPAPGLHPPEPHRHPGVE